jgi:hypothetical protein
MTPLERITERVNRNGDVNDVATPRPLLMLEEFFEGNTLTGSICCNCIPTPEPHEMFELLKQIRSRPDVGDVRVEVSMFDEPEWLFSETVWVVTSARAAEVKLWFEKSIRPDETWKGWKTGWMVESIFIPADMHPVGCWWD